MSQPGLTAQVSKCRIELEHGDITQQSTVAIVNSMCGGKKLGGGECNKAIKTAAGSSVENEYTEINTTGNLDIVMTNAGDLKQDKIFNVIARKDAAAIQNVVDRTLKMAETEEMASIAFPALGTGKRGGNAKKLAVPMFEAMRDFVLEEQPIILRTIRLVIYQSKLYDIYKEAMQETLGQYCTVD